MRVRNRWVVLSSALLASCALSGCDMPRSLAALLGDERTLPDGAEVTFERPHRPILNPIDDSGLSQNAATHRTSYDNAQSGSSGYQTSSNTSGRRIPAENIAMLSGNAPAEPPPMHADTRVAAVTTSSPSYASLHPAPAVPTPPVARISGMQDMTATGSQSADTATDAVKLNPPLSAPGAGENISHIPSAPIAGASESTGAFPSKPSAGSASDAAAVAAAAQAAASEIPNTTPSLASVPDAPKPIPATQIASDMNSLKSEREASLNAGQELQANASSTVMTSPETGKVVADATHAEPAVPPTNAAVTVSDKGFDGWLHSLDASGGIKPAAKSADTTTPPASEAATPAASEPEKQVALLAPASSATTDANAVKLHPPTSFSDSPPTDITASVPPKPTLDTMDAAKSPAAATAPVELHTAPGIAESAPVDASKQTPDTASPTASDAGADTENMLPDPRYANRHLPPINEAY